MAHRLPTSPTDKQTILRPRHAGVSTGLSEREEKGRTLTWHIELRTMLAAIVSALDVRLFPM